MKRFGFVILLSFGGFLSGFDKSPSAALFIGRRGNIVELIDRNGKGTLRKVIPGITRMYPLGGGFIDYGTEDDFHGLLNGDLDVLIEPGIYVSFERGYRDNDGSRSDCDLLICTHNLSGNPEDLDAVRRIDVLELPSLDKIVTGLTRLDGIGPDRLAVVRGFSAGLIDWNGNWIVQKSIFDALNDG